jgi:two-component system response regulator YesN
MWKIIVIDDEAYVRKGIVLSVDWEALGCVVVAEASDGYQALDLTRKLKPDLLISDIEMPGLDGIEMLKILRAEGNAVDIIFLTAHSDFDYAKNALKLYASDYLLKPFEDGELEDTIKRIKTKNKKNRIAKINIIETDIGNNLSIYVKASVKYINNKYKEDLTVSKIAEEIGISEGHLSRIFKKETNYTVMNYITNCRMHHAMKFLKDCRYKVYEIAEMVGYKDINYFSSTFKKVVGLTPSMYQNKHNL